MTRAASYIRVSSEEQATKGYGLEAQTEHVRGHTAGKRYVVQASHAYADVWTGRREDRPQFQAMLAAAKRREFDVVVVARYDRFSRHPRLGLNLAAELRRYVKLEFYGAPENDGSPMGEFTEGLHMLLAGLDWGQLRQKMMDGRRLAAKCHRRPAGRPSYGFKSIPGESKGRVQVPELEEAPVVLLMYQWNDAGWSLQQIVRELIARAIPSRSGRRWSKQTVLMILRNEANVGRMHYGRRPRNGVLGDVYTIKVPALVPEALFARVQARLTANQRERAGRPGDPAYILKGLPRCPTHDRALTAHTAHDKGKGYRYYECPDGRGIPGGRCRLRVKASDLEAEVWEYVSALLHDPVLLSKRLQEWDDRLAIRDLETSSSVEYLEGKLRDLDRRIARLVDGLETGSPAAKTRLAEREQERATMAARLAEALARVVRNPAMPAPQLAARCRALAAAMDRQAPGDVVGRAELLRSLLRRIMVHPTELEMHGPLFCAEMDAVGNRPALLVARDDTTKSERVYALALARMTGGR